MWSLFNDTKIYFLVPLSNTWQFASALHSDLYRIYPIRVKLGFQIQPVNPEGNHKWPFVPESPRQR